jgi:hypothetical protein
VSRFERWSLKKRGIESDEAAVPRDNVAAENEEIDALNAVSGGDESLGSQEATVEDTPPPGSLDHTLPDPDDLPAGSDFSVFMASGVSAALRRRALKRLWATGNYNVRDGLDDYDADYRQQLKPMASELAGKLRRWANKAEEALEKPVSENEADATVEKVPASDEHENTASSERKSQLDDPSDSFCNDVDECTKRKLS